MSDRLTINPGLRYTLNFPSTEINGQTAVLNLQTRLLDYPGTDPVRPLKKNNFGPRFGAVYRMTDKTIVSSGYGLVWIEMAGITTPFTTPMFPFLQTVSLRTLDNIAPAFVLANGPTVTPIALTPTAGLGQGVFTVDGTLGSGYAQQWNVSVQRELTANTVVEVSYLGSKITNIGIPDSNVNQLTEEQLKLGPALLTPRVPNPYFGIIPRSSSIGDPTVTPAQLMKPYPEYTAVSFYRNNVGTTNYQGVAFSIRQRWSRGLTYSAAYTRSKLTDIASSVFDASILTGPLTNAAVADSFNLERDRDYSTGDIPHYFAASLVWDLPAGEGRAKQPRGIVGALVNDWSVATLMTAAVRCAGRRDPGEFARLRRLHDPAAESRRRSHAARGRADPRSLVQYLGVRHRQSVHDWIRLPQSGAGTVVPRCRSRGDASHRARRRARDRVARGDLQSAEYHEFRRTAGHGRRGELRDDYDGPRSTGRAARGEVLVLT